MLVQLWPTGKSLEVRETGDTFQVRDGDVWRAATVTEARGIKIEQIAEQLLSQEVLCCDSSLVDDLLQLSSEGTHLGGEFSMDNVSNLYPDASDWTLEQCREWMDDHNDGNRLPTPNPWAMDRADMLEHMHIELDDDFDNGDDDAVRTRLIAEINDETWDGLSEWRDAVRDNAEAAEVLEWWRVSKWLADHLEAVGECVLSNNYGTWWGRCCTGQGLLQDGILQLVAARIL